MKPHKYLENSTVEKLLTDIQALMAEAVNTHDMTAVELVGVLEMLKGDVLRQAFKEPFVELN